MISYFYHIFITFYLNLHFNLIYITYVDWQRINIQGCSKVSLQLVLLPLEPEAHSNADDGRDNEERWPWFQIDNKQSGEVPHKEPSGGGRGQRTTLSGPTGQVLHATRGLHRRLRSPRLNLHSPERSMEMAHEKAHGCERRAHWAPAWGRHAHWAPAGEILREPCGPPIFFFFFEGDKVGSSDLFWYMFWAQGNSVCKVNGRGWLPNSEPVPYSGKPKEFSKGEGVPLWWGGGGTRKATVPERTLALRVRRTNTRPRNCSAPPARTRGTQQRWRRTWQWGAMTLISKWQH